ncbi:hypothetical protein BDY19DRAFT_964928 [Irpex rosettiformis]|uniref:Uncharacterized protein n=1 Tax=Irpex rosettiformis TaxID=378272 RepID=A0ACB8TV11_9APHY|nr:hypothetical protein BDY19DRAFT_964928 [Irpex rosettiformis]
MRAQVMWFALLNLEVKSVAQFKHEQPHPLQWADPLFPQWTRRSRAYTMPTCLSAISSCRAHFCLKPSSPLDEYSSRPNPPSGPYPSAPPAFRREGRDCGRNLLHRTAGSPGHTNPPNASTH